MTKKNGFCAIMALQVHAMPLHFMSNCEKNCLTTLFKWGKHGKYT